jgi:hypothetical protein
LDELVLSRLPVEPQPVQKVDSDPSALSRHFEQAVRIFNGRKQEPGGQAAVGLNPEERPKNPVFQLGQNIFSKLC